MFKVSQHNKAVMISAQSRASEMEMWPSPLEKRMKDFLESNKIEYQQQYIFYIYGSNGWISKYYIADFYVPSKRLIIEVDGKFHDKHKQHDKMRTKEIQTNYPGVEVVRYQWKDLSDKDKMSELLSMVK